MQILSLNDFTLYFHKTFELTHIINDICDLIITMNITRSCLKNIASKEKTICYFVSCFRDIKDLVKERYYITSVHLKLYRTKDFIFLSTSNLSLSAWHEITIKIARNATLDLLCDIIVSTLKPQSDFVKHFW